MKKLLIKRKIFSVILTLCMMTSLMGSVPASVEDDGGSFGDSASETDLNTDTTEEETVSEETAEEPTEESTEETALEETTEETTEETPPEETTTEDKTGEEVPEETTVEGEDETGTTTENEEEDDENISTATDIPEDNETPEETTEPEDEEENPGTPTDAGDDEEILEKDYFFENQIMQFNQPTSFDPEIIKIFTKTAKPADEEGTFRQYDIELSFTVGASTETIVDAGEYVEEIPGGVKNTGNGSQQGLTSAIPNGNGKTGGIYLDGIDKGTEYFYLDENGEYIKIIPNAYVDNNVTLNDLSGNTKVYGVNGQEGISGKKKCIWIPGYTEGVPGISGDYGNFNQNENNKFYNNDGTNSGIKFTIYTRPGSTTINLYNAVTDLVITDTIPDKFEYAGIIDGDANFDIDDDGSLTNLIISGKREKYTNPNTYTVTYRIKLKDESYFKSGEADYAIPTAAIKYMPIEDGGADYCDEQEFNTEKDSTKIDIPPLFWVDLKIYGDEEINPERATGSNNTYATIALGDTAQLKSILVLGDRNDYIDEEGHISYEGTDTVSISNVQTRMGITFGDSAEDDLPSNWADYYIPTNYARVGGNMAEWNPRSRAVSVGRFPREEDFFKIDSELGLNFLGIGYKTLYGIYKYKIIESMPDINKSAHGYFRATSNEVTLKVIVGKLVIRVVSDPEEGSMGDLEYADVTVIKPKEITSEDEVFHVAGEINGKERVYEKVANAESYTATAYVPYGYKTTETEYTAVPEEDNESGGYYYLIEIVIEKIPQPFYRDSSALAPTTGAKS